MDHFDSMTSIEQVELIKFGFFVEDGFEEESELVDKYNKCKTTNKLELIVMASTMCNFNCRYCYEDYIPKAINDSFSESFLKYIENGLDNINGLVINWFGGEPLLARKHIISISKKIKEIARSKKKPYVSSITTNGYFLDAPTFLELLEGNILFYQITIDGCRDWHNKYRPLKNGEGTYDTIISNLLEIKKAAPPYKTFNIVIRNNVNKENQKACSEFVEVFSSLFGDDNRFELFWYPIKDWGGERIEEMKEHLLNSEYIEYNGRSMFRNDLFESLEGSGCVAGKKNGFVIDSDLRVYKCNHYIQKEYGIKYTNEVGYIDTNGELQLDDELNNKWLTVPIHKSCYGCKCLPNCLVSCPLHPVMPVAGCKEREIKKITDDIYEHIRLKG